MVDDHRVPYSVTHVLQNPRVGRVGLARVRRKVGVHVLLGYAQPGLPARRRQPSTWRATPNRSLRYRCGSGRRPGVDRRCARCRDNGSPQHWTGNPAPLCHLHDVRIHEGWAQLELHADGRLVVRHVDGVLIGTSFPGPSPDAIAAIVAIAEKLASLGPALPWRHPAPTRHHCRDAATRAQ